MLEHDGGNAVSKDEILKSESDSPNTSVLQFSCPYCSHGYQDGLELLPAGIVHEFTCENCRQFFVLQIAECPHCAEESVAASRAVVGKSQLAPSVCGACGRPFEAFDEVPE